MTGLAALVAACGSMPASAPLQRQIVEATEVSTVGDIAIYPVTRSFVPVIQEWPTAERDLSWIPASGGAQTQVIAAGDEVALTIWDSVDDPSSPTEIHLPFCTVSSLRPTARSSCLVLATPGSPG